MIDVLGLQDAKQNLVAVETVASGESMLLSYSSLCAGTAPSDDHTDTLSPRLPPLWPPVLSLLSLSTACSTSFSFASLEQEVHLRLGGGASELQDFSFQFPFPSALPAICHNVLYIHGLR